MVTLSISSAMAPLGPTQATTDPVRADSRAGKLWLWVFLTGFALLCGLVIAVLKTPPFYGDLTRIGLLSETAFGWRIAPPHIESSYLNASPISEADVLVIGDSFSMSHRWQSLLIRAGYKTSTTFWGQYNEALCADFDDWLDRAGFRGKLVIIESVERLLNGRLSNSQTCSTMAAPLFVERQPHFPPLNEVPPPTLNWDGQLIPSINTFINTQQARQAEGNFLSNKKVLVRPVADGCALFSHQLCDRAPFWLEDDTNGELTRQNEGQMRAFTTTRTRRQLLWMVIPNKTTVYAKPQHSKDFVAALRKTDLGPDLFSFSQEQKTKVRDYYFPNDTHLSMHGQLAVGQRMLEAVRQVFPITLSKAP